MKCCICGLGAERVTLFRITTRKGPRSVWACLTHLRHADGAPLSAGERSHIGKALERSALDERRKCKLCGRALNQPEEPDSADCGGDCKGCMDAIERGDL